MQTLVESGHRDILIGVFGDLGFSGNLNVKVEEICKCSELSWKFISKPSVDRQGALEYSRFCLRTILVYGLKEFRSQEAELAELGGKTTRVPGNIQLFLIID
jgi:hypothetical protein